MDALYKRRFEVLDKEVEKIDKDMEELYDEKKTAEQGEKAELKARITNKEAEKQDVRAERRIVSGKLEGGGRVKRDQTEAGLSQGGSAAKRTRSEKADSTCVGVSPGGLKDPAHGSASARIRGVMHLRD